MLVTSFVAVIHWLIQWEY